MTDTDRIEHQTDEETIEVSLEEWDEFVDDETAYEEFLDWLEGRD